METAKPWALAVAESSPTEETYSMAREDADVEDRPDVGGHGAAGG